MANHPALLFLASLMLGCSGAAEGADASSDSAVTDAISGDAALDSAVADAIAYDSMPLTFCAGTSVAGTCAQAFFQSANNCFEHVEGQCTYDYRDPGPSIACWSDGARIEYTFEVDNTHLVWRNPANTICMEADGDGTVSTATRNGQTLTVNDDTGEVTCPDGSTASIPFGLRACNDLYRLFEPGCQNGTCP